MIVLDKKKQQKVHSRQIDIAIYEGAAGSIIVEGILKDERLLASYLLTNDVMPPGILHHMIIRMEVAIADLVIRDIEVEMPTTPQKECAETRNCLEPVKGMPIASGFTVKVKDLIGGINGCSHLLALLTAMAPAAYQGRYSALVKEPVDQESHRPAVVSSLKNTCWVWREDGPLVTRLK